MISSRIIINNFLITTRKYCNILEILQIPVFPHLLAGKIFTEEQKSDLKNLI